MMSKFFSPKFRELTPYTPGEQPKTGQYVKLNTNESPFAPSQNALKAAEAALKTLQLYPDPECRALREKMAGILGVKPEQIIFTNGSDEVLNFAFMAFCDRDTPAAFADITYGFYPVFAALNGVPYTTIPLAEDFSIDVKDYVGLNKTIFIANPNAPTGKLLTLEQIEQIVAANSENVVVIDEAYIDFGGESAVCLIHKYKNLLVTGTFSKSRSAAGARLGFGVADEALIADLNTIRYSTNPYNVNALTMALGFGILEDESYTKENCQSIIKNRAYTTEHLRALGFEVIESAANFVFAKTDAIGGKALYEKLKEKNVLVRHFEKERIREYNRITIGTAEQMRQLLQAIEEILAEVNA